MFDALSEGVISTGAAEEPVLASKLRKRKEKGSKTQGKRADKCWRLANGLEVGWQEASKNDAVSDPDKYEEDILKTLKGCKDMADRVRERCGRNVEVFGFVTSKDDATIFSVVRLPSGACIAKTLVTLHAYARSYATFCNWLQTVRISLCVLRCFDKLSQPLLKPKFVSDSDDSDVSGGSYGGLPTMPTPVKPKSANKGPEKREKKRRLK
ncbi:hypothetical protein HDU87_004876 [Geranomyces variabilis]|uniref:Uncharacterized protein n=1 Tax=Geranomyces variabilis TaxID=109894 RepID=A0AAD5TJ71_9FUNG|nr:hypothetical protein HDU87_004876 [Geranomyces variabilis]